MTLPVIIIFFRPHFRQSIKAAAGHIDVVPSASRRCLSFPEEAATLYFRGAEMSLCPFLPEATRWRTLYHLRHRFLCHDKRLANDPEATRWLYKLGVYIPVLHRGPCGCPSLPELFVDAYEFVDTHVSYSSRVDKIENTALTEASIPAG